MTTDLRSRTQYLSLALFTQRVIRALLDYSEGTRTPALQTSLTDALRALEHLNRGDLPNLTQRKGVVFNSYEHLRTLEEVWSVPERTRAVQIISTLLSGTSDPSGNRTPAHELIGLFGRLGNHARWNFEQPSTMSPRTIRELCQVP
jgi:hypothetical protein